ncbi:MAG: M23 family metallopeptidase [Patescibacteria group bacterium]|jgi:hypothetical protein
MLQQYFVSTFRLKKYIFSVFLLFLFFSFFLHISPAQAEIRNLTFPVIGNVRYSNDFGAPRSGGRTHEGNDLLGFKRQLLIAAVDGYVRYVPYPEPSWGYAVTITDADGYAYNYYHVNDDRPGTDDGLGGGMFAYAPDMRRGNPVVAGQLIGWMGDSGNAERTTPHLHFEIRRPDGNAINPFESLQAATKIDRLVPAPQIDDEIVPFGEFQGGASIARGNVDDRYEGDELVVGAGPGGGAHVRMFDETGVATGQFFAFPETFKGGVNVATGDIDGNGLDEIITSIASLGGPQVRIFDWSGKLITQFFAFDQAFRGGVRLAAADLNNDGLEEIIAGTGPGTATRVRVFDHKTNILADISAFPESFRGGIDVAGAAATENTEGIIIVGAGPGGGPHVRLFDISGTLRGQFFAYDPLFRGGVRVDANDIDGDGTSEILTAPAQGGGAHFRLFSMRATPLDSFDEYETWWRSGYDITGSQGTIYVVANSGRRVSIRAVLQPTLSSNNQQFDFFQTPDPEGSF